MADSVQEIVADPQFWQFDQKTQLQLLSSADPDVGKMGQEDQVRLLGSLRPQPQAALTPQQQLLQNSYKLQQAVSKYPEPENFVNYAQNYWGNTANFYGKQAQQDINRIAGPESEKTSPVDKIISSFAAAYHQTSRVMAKGYQGMADPKQAAVMASGLIDPAIPGAYYATQATAGLAGIGQPSSINTAIQNPTPENVEAPLLQGSQLAAIGTGMVPEKVPLRPAQAVETIKDAVNPSPKSVPKYEEALNNQISNIEKFAQENKIAITDRESFANVAKRAGQSARDEYYGWLKPIESERITPPQSYQGAVLGSHPQPVATLGQLDARLTEINATLNPYYEKGGGANIAAQAAVSSETRSALTAEAAQIRNTLYKEIATRQQVPVEQVAATRRTMGELRYIAEQTNLALNKEQFNVNAAKQQPINLESTLAGIAGRAVQSRVRARFGTPGDRAVGNVFKGKQ